MKIIKTLFLISLFNFLTTGAVVLALKGKITNKQETSVPNNNQVLITNDQNKTETPVVTEMPIATATLIPTFKAIIKNTDPFVGIFKAPSTDLRTSTPTVVSTSNNNTVTTGQNTQPTTAAVAPTTPPAVADNRCIITVDGINYNVTDFRNQHSGGNIFQCGSDMSATFHGQHPNSFLQKMAKYRI